VATCGDRLPGVSPARPHSTAAGRWCRQDGSRSHPATPGAIDHPAPPAGRQPHLPGQAGPESRTRIAVARCSARTRACSSAKQGGQRGRHPSARRPAAGSARAGCASQPGFHAPAGGTQVGVRLENGIYGHSRFCNTDFDDKLACLNLSGV
jgi:hypothetical protein